MESLTHTAASVRVQVLESRKGDQYKNPGDVEVLVKYPEGYAGPRFIPEGPITTSKEGAEDLVKRGIASVIPATAETAAEAVEAVETNATETVSEEANTENPATAETAGKGKKSGKK